MVFLMCSSVVVRYSSGIMRYGRKSLRPKPTGRIRANILSFFFNLVVSGAWTIRIVSLRVRLWSLSAPRKFLCLIS